MLPLKENLQNEQWGINMCGAVDQMIAEGMERGIVQGTERGKKYDRIMPGVGRNL